MDRKDDSVSRILKNVHLEPDLAAELDKYRRNITVMFTDIKGSTSYFERFGDSAGMAMVYRCNSSLGEIVKSHGGHVIKTIGDSIMASFDDTAEAVAASVEMQIKITDNETAKPEAHRISIRIGLHYGSGIVKKNDVFGDVANTASRVETNAAPEQIVVSDTVQRALAEDRRFTFRHLGKFELKGKAETRDLYEVAWNRKSVTLATATHSMIAPSLRTATTSGFKLQQVRGDGSHGIVFSFKRGEVIIGRSEGEMVFPHDAKMLPQHARVSIKDGQLFIEPIQGAMVFFSLIGPYRLKDGDVIRMAKQAFEFHANTSALERAAATGVRMRALVDLLKKPPAGFASLGSDQRHYLIKEDEVTFGRTKGTYTFPDDPNMSRSHAKVFHRGEDFFLEDNGSRNGTFVKVRGKTQVPAGVTLMLSGQLLNVAQVFEE